MEKVLKAIKQCTTKYCVPFENECIDCPYRSKSRCVDMVMSDAEKILLTANRRFYNIEKMLTEWEMVDQRAALLHEIELWKKAIEL